jgi:hypothetical protein
MSDFQPYRTTIKDLLDASSNISKRPRDTIMYIIDEYEDKIAELERKIVRLNDSMSNIIYFVNRSKEEEDDDDKDVTSETPGPILTPADHDRITRDIDLKEIERNARITEAREKLLRHLDPISLTPADHDRITRESKEMLE